MKLSPWEPDLASVVNRIQQNDIDLQPDFQRQEVWPLPKKKRLIDTVLRDWSIPAVHLVVTSDDRLVVLDGQQRLAAIRDFINNKFPIDGNIAPVDDRISALDGRYFSELDAQTKRRIENYTVRAFRITEYRPEEPNELFYRLNQPTALTAGEQRNALFGVARDQLKYLVDKFESLGNEKTTIGFSNSRMSYDDILAKFMFFIERKNFGLRSSESLISERFKYSHAFSDEVISRCVSSIRQFSECRSFSEKFRFNKANILSWLIFFARFEYFNHPEFLNVFMTSVRDRDSIFSMRPHYSDDLNRSISQAAEVFDDRSSLRVSDVSSIVYRDVSLWMVYILLGYDDIPSVIPVHQLEYVINAHKNSRASLADVFGENIYIEEWSASL